MNSEDPFLDQKMLDPIMENEKDSRFTNSPQSLSQTLPEPVTASSSTQRQRFPPRNEANPSLASGSDVILTPAHNPPAFSWFDVFPFTLIGNCLGRVGIKVGGRKAQRRRMKELISDNLPLEITLYIVREELLLCHQLFNDHDLTFKRGLISLNYKPGRLWMYLP